MYESMIHWISDVLAPRSRMSDGMAMLSTMLSMTTTSRLRQSTPRINQRRGLRSGMTGFPRTTFE
jgi:hypothetical protein